MLSAQTVYYPTSQQHQLSERLAGSYTEFAAPEATTANTCRYCAASPCCCGQASESMQTLKETAKGKTFDSARFIHRLDRLNAQASLPLTLDAEQPQQSQHAAQLSLQRQCFNRFNRLANMRATSRVEQ